MKRFFFLVMLIFIPCSFMTLQAQELERQQQHQQAMIEQAYKKKQVTQREYYKLLDEQEIIKNAIAKAKADDYMHAKEKNAIYGKLQRAEKRLRKYKTNREEY